jgi:hypothetical protein
VRETPAGNLIRFPVIMEDPRDIAWNTQGDFAIRFLGRKVLFYDSITEEFRDLPIW